MSSTTSAIPPESHEPGAVPRVAAGTTTAQTALFSPVRLAILALTAGTLAGLGSWFAGESARTAFRPELKPVQAMGVTIMQADLADEIAADTKNAVLTYGILGAALGLALGLAGGLARHNARLAAIYGLLGLILGGAAGGLATFLAVPFYFRMIQEDPLSFDLVLPFLVHSGIGAAVGAASGVVFGSAMNPRRYAALGLIGGLMGGIVGAAVYEFAGGYLFPMAKTPQPISASWESRLLAHLAIAVCAAAGAWLIVVRSGNKLAPSPATVRLD